MSKRTYTQLEVEKIRREAEAVRQLTETEGWQILKTDLEEQMVRITRLLTENRLRTKQETVKTTEGATTFVTTAETQIAENAGMYKMAKQVFITVQTIIEGPKRLADLEQKGTVTIEGKEVNNDGSKREGNGTGSA